MPTSTTRTAVSKRLASVTPLLLTLFVFAVAPARAPAQTTAFTYQGQLTEGTTGANGNYDLQFGLFDTAAAGTQIGATQNAPAVVVTSGLFTVQLDFGVNAFPGANRFLEIGVRPAGGVSFTTLTPRQQISSTPYAIRTLSAATADALSGACVGCVQDTQIQSVAGSKVSGTIAVASVPAGSGNYIQNKTTEQPNANFNVSGNGRVGGNLTVAGTLNANVGGNFIQNRTTPQPTANFNISGDGTVGGTLSANVVNATTRVGIGTTNPAEKLTIAGVSNYNNGLKLTGNAADGTGLALENTSAGGHKFALLSGGAADDIGAGAFGIYDDSIGAYRLAIGAGGSVGIGTTTPAAKLHIAGSAVVDANVGIGTTSPSSGRLHVEGGGAVGVFGNSNTEAGVSGHSTTNTAVRGISTSGSGVSGQSDSDAGVRGFSESFVAVNALSRTGPLFRGQNFIVPTVRFIVENDGTVRAKAYEGPPDFAEQIRPSPADQSRLEPGDVLVAAADTDRSVSRSREPYSTSVLGVYSTAPGFIGTEHPLDGDSAETIPMAIIGIVPCKVSAENGPVRRGDLLTTSRTPGHAMKASPLRVSGVEIYPAGTILGKALEPLEEGTGVLKALVTLQ